jgi:ABC-type multidrug transport system ATPase subunit
MEIQLDQVGKKFGKNWIFKDISYSFLPNNSYAVLGNNGSGKSTLLKIISSQTSPNKGQVIYKDCETENAYTRISYCAPYLELIEELSFEELLVFVEKFKPFLPDYPPQRILDIFQFDKNKWVKDYSSGMKQRVKLALALFADVDVVLLDEPTSNLDEKGVSWFLETLDLVINERTLILASNVEREYQTCKNIIDMQEFKN